MTVISIAAVLCSAGCGASGRPQDPEPWPAGRASAERAAPYGDQLDQLLRSPLEQRITLRLRDVPLETALQDICKPLGLGFAIINHPKTPLVQLDAADLSARKALDWVTRQAGAYYMMSDRRTVVVFWDESHVLSGRIEMRTYSVGGLLRFDRPVDGGGYASMETQAWENFLHSVVRPCLQPIIDANPECQFVLDNTKSQLMAMLPPEGHKKLQAILDEVKKTRKYEPVAAALIPDSAAVLATPIDGTIDGDVRDVAAELARRAKTNIGFNYAQVALERRRVTLKLGKTTLGDALDAFSKATGLGDVVAERDGGIWILAPRETPRMFWRSGELPLERCILRSYYIADAAKFFGPDLILREIRQKVSPGEWADKQPLVVYQPATGRLIVLHDPAGQAAVAQIIQKRMQLLTPERTP